MCLKQPISIDINYFTDKVISCLLNIDFLYFLKQRNKIKYKRKFYAALQSQQKMMHDRSSISRNKVTRRQDYAPIYNVMMSAASSTYCYGSDFLIKQR